MKPPNPTGNELGEILDSLSDSSASRGWLDCKSGSEDTHPRNDLVQIAKSKLTKYIEQEIKKARIEAVDYFYWRIDCNTLISELEGWRGCIDNAKDQTERHFNELGESNGR